MKLSELTALLCLTWSISLLYGEMLAFLLPSLTSTCQWPHHHHHSNSSSYFHVAVIADPQLTDRTSLPRLSPNSLALHLVQFYSDLYMRRAFLSSIVALNPDVAIFLGDLFDGGPHLSDEEWKESLSRLRHVFPVSRIEETTRLYWMAGNHDIGYEDTHTRAPQAVIRYEKEFGSRNYQFRVGQVEFVAIDSQDVDGNPQFYTSSSTLAFVKNVTLDTRAYPRVLLTHIPLYRQDETDCGPNRKSKIVNQGIVHSPDRKEITYQKYISEESSKYLLDSIQPVRVISGHDHDQCDVVHKSKYGPVKEHTVGTISWQQGNVYPFFMLLSAGDFVPSNTSSSDELVLTQLCFLPVQLHIYMWYLSLFAFTVLALLLWPAGGASIWQNFSDLLACGKQLISSITSRPKEKDEDQNCEYEMMWDAEGSMHLVKKSLNIAATSKSEKVSVERGTTVMRATAKKSISQEQENVDVFDPMVKTLPRASKSWTKLVIQRLIRTVRMVTVIAAINVPLYMLLLFKDWID